MKITIEFLQELKLLRETTLLSNKEIAEKLNVKSSVVTKYINSNYKIIDKKNLTYRVNLVHDYFENIDTLEKAYYLGFIAGDGNINDTMVRIRIVRTDEEVVNNFKNEICYYKTNLYAKPKNGKEQVWLSVRSVKMVYDLKKYGIIPNKTFSLRMPDIKDEYICAFLLGFFDADGSVFYTNFTRKSGSRAGEVVEKYRFDITTNTEFAIQIQKYLNQKIGTDLKVYNNKKNPNISSIQVSRNSDMVLLGEYLYSNNNIGLVRKKEKFKQAVNFYK
jgi:hypothetical protein